MFFLYNRPGPPPDASIDSPTVAAAAQTDVPINGYSPRTFQGVVQIEIDSAWTDWVYLSTGDFATGTGYFSKTASIDGVVDVGTYNVRLVANGAGGTDTSENLIFLVANPPTGSIDSPYADEETTAGNLVVVGGSASTDSGGTVQILTLQYYDPQNGGWNSIGSNIPVLEGGSWQSDLTLVEGTSRRQITILAEVLDNFTLLSTYVYRYFYASPPT